MTSRAPSVRQPRRDCDRSSGLHRSSRRGFDVAEGLARYVVHDSSVLANGVVRWFDEDEGWGVIDSDATPGGAAVIFMDIEGDGYRALDPGQQVTFLPVDMRPNNQDGYPWRAERVATSNAPDRSYLDPDEPIRDAELMGAQGGQAIVVATRIAPAKLSVMGSAIAQAVMASLAVTVVVLAVLFVPAELLNFAQSTTGIGERIVSVFGSMLWPVAFSLLFAIPTALYLGLVVGVCVGLVIKRMRPERSMKAIRWAAAATTLAAIAGALAIVPLLWPSGPSWPFVLIAAFPAPVAPLIAAWRASDIARADRK